MSDNTDISPTGDMAIIGEEPDAGHPVSMKALQAIYNEITGKSEELSKHYDDAFRVSFADIEQLNLKVGQVCEQYSVESTNVTVTVYHLDDTKETFSSFERFRLYNKSSTSPVESILLKYNLLIVLPKTRRAQSYTISIRIASRITALKRLLRQVPPASGIIRFLVTQTAVVTISYVDYMVARNLLTVVDSWFDTLSKSETPRVLTLFRNYSELLVGIGGYGLGALSLLLVIRVLPFQINASSSLADLARFLLLAFTSMFFIYRLGRFLGRSAGESLLTWQELGFLELNRGDEKEIERAKKENRFALVRSLASAIGAVLAAIAAKLIATLLTQ